MKEQFDALERRAAAVLVTIAELVDRTPGISRTTYWRAANGHVKTSARVRVLRTVTEELSAIEREKAMDILTPTDTAVAA